jgi:hypothetical protein
MGQIYDLACGRGIISTAALRILCNSTNMWFADPQLHVWLGVFTSNPILEQGSVEGLEQPWSWFAEGQEGAGVVI